MDTVRRGADRSTSDSGSGTVLRRDRPSVLLRGCGSCVRDANEVVATDLAQARFVLARALVEAGKSTDRAIALAEQARAAYQDAGDVHADELAEIEGWLREHARRR